MSADNLTYKVSCDCGYTVEGLPLVQANLFAFQHDGPGHLVGAYPDASPVGSSVPGNTPATGGIFAIVCYTKCWACNFNQHPGGTHDWADQDDIEHAAQTGQASPVGQCCGCHRAAGPALPPEPDEPDWDEVPYRNEPCATCGEVGACGYDAEGRALIHVTAEEGEADD